jgi:hypothetical protein
MSKVDAPTVATLLREYAQRTALRGGNPYRAKAYSRAADSLAALALPLHVLIAENRLTEIPGVGDAIADIVTKLHKTGTHPSLEKLRKEIPEAVLEMLAVPGLRPEKVLRLYEDLGITSLVGLEPPRRTTASRTPKDWARRCRPRSCRTWPSRKAERVAFTCTVPPPCSRTPRTRFARPGRSSSA